MHTNAHTGKLGVLVNAREEGLGVQDTAKREALIDDLNAWKQLQ